MAPSWRPPAPSPFPVSGCPGLVVSPLPSSKVLYYFVRFCLDLLSFLFSSLNPAVILPPFLLILAIFLMNFWTALTIFFSKNMSRFFCTQIVSLSGSREFYFVLSVLGEIRGYGYESGLLLYIFWNSGLALCWFGRMVCWLVEFNARLGFVSFYS